jgi:hypothetical protein
MAIIPFLSAVWPVRSPRQLHRTPFEAGFTLVRLGRSANTWLIATKTKTENAAVPLNRGVSFFS